MIERINSWQPKFFTFHVLAMHLLNEESAYCIIPRQWRNFEKLLDEDEDGVVTEKEIENAKEVLRKARMKDA